MVAAASLMAARTRLYVPQRHTLPLIAASMSASLGFLFFDSSAAALINWPDWQYPHCGTSCLIHATCSGCELLVERLSIVATFWPAAAESGVWQERTGWPFRCTVHAPHSAWPHPNLVPVKPISSRIT